MINFSEEYRWPKKGDNPFPEGSVYRKSPTWASLQWLGSLNVGDSFLADAFKEAGDKIIKELDRGEDPQHAEKFFLPITYLYRHSLELQMKEIIRLGIELELIEKDKRLSTTLNGHKLHALWNYVKKVAIQYWPDSPKEDISTVERIIQEFHKIDKSGQNLRYSKDTEGRNTLTQLPKAVELNQLKDVFEGIHNFLSGCEDGLYEALQIRNDMLSSY